MFDVTLYNFSKPENSTQRPAEGTMYRCRMKAPCGIVSPVLEIQTEADFIPVFNYAYIPAFNRYYWVREWTNRAGNVWEVPCSVDVLATYRDQIGGASLYIERSSSEYDGELSDNLYPIASNEVVTKLALDWGWTTNLLNGRYILSAVSKRAGSALPLDYFIMTSEQFGAFRSKLYNDISWADFGSIAEGLAQTIADPFQYIKTVQWFPFVPTVFGVPSSIQFAYWDSEVQSTRLANGATVETITKNVVPPRHPLASSRGMYCNCSPFADYILHVEPFGMIVLDSVGVAHADSLDLELKVDLMTGIGTLCIWQVVGNARTDLLSRSVAPFAVDIPLSQSTQNVLGAVGSAAGTVASIFGGNIGGALSSVSSVGTALTPQIESKGSQGSVAGFGMSSELLCRFKKIAYDDNAHNGRPLGAVRQISAIPGYIEVQKGVVPIPGTQAESEQVRAYLEGGFYYV